MKTTVWSLAPKSGRRFLQGHPWVFANELAASPKGIAPGAPIELRDEHGKFLARGYGNAQSLIAFRALSRHSARLEPWTLSELGERVITAAQYRQSLGLGHFSHRLIFGEADDLPGLVIDRFVDSQGENQVLVVQLLTAGMERLLPNLEEFVDAWVEPATHLKMAQTTLVVRRDVGTRKLEGLSLEEPQMVGKSVHSLENFPAWVERADRHGGLTFQVNLISGQKTGFFFDQAGNLNALARILQSSPPPSNFQILDLFCYVGQWGTQLSAMAKELGGIPQIHLVDASAAALKLATQNVQAAGGQATTYELDILEGLASVPDSDVVICDPPAFIKSKKDLAAGMKGYIKANTMALKKVRPGGWFISCSCSHHLSENDFVEVLRQAENRAGVKVRWLVHGIQAPDHPVRLSFPEGRYLKAWIGRVDAT